MKHVNAEDVLPQDLLREVQQHYTGYIYVSRSREFYAARRRMVTELHHSGLSTRDIAEKVHLCVRRVQQIIREQTASGRTEGGRPHASFLE